MNLVTVRFTVTEPDGPDGKYVTGLTPADIKVQEYVAEEQVSDFSEEHKGISHTSDPAESTFVLFDTSNCMYAGFAYAEDTLARFIRSLGPGHPVAVYTFSQNTTRTTRLTRDTESAIRGLRNAVAGENTAVFDALLLTIRDASQVPGRKSIVVLSNGPDDSSVLAPDDVGAVAEQEGVAIYMKSPAGFHRVKIKVDRKSKCIVRASRQGYLAAPRTVFYRARR